MDEPRPATSLTREQLYELVWTTPMLHVARRFSISNFELVKICEKHNIPRPPLGYWAKKEVGKAPARAPLPPQPSASPITLEEPCVENAPVASADAAEVPQYGGELQDVYQKARDLPPIVVRTEGELHPILCEHGEDGLPPCICVNKKDAPLYRPEFFGQSGSHKASGKKRNVKRPVELGLCPRPRDF